jgi:hypothetical protein
MMEAAKIKKAIVHEFAEYLWFLIYMALFFGIFTTYRMLITHDFHEASFEYWTGFVNALVLSKVVLLGQHAHVGVRHEHRSVIISAIYKSLLFALLVAVFHVVEDFVKDLIHGHSAADAFQEITVRQFDRLLVFTVVVFCVFIPLFAIWETRRIIGDHEFDQLFFHRGSTKHRHAAAETQEV